MDRIGRKHSIIVGTIITAAGIGIQVASHDWKLFLGGRLVNGKDLPGILDQFPANSNSNWLRYRVCDLSRLDRRDCPTRTSWAFSLHHQWVYCSGPVHPSVCASNLYFFQLLFY